MYEIEKNVALPPEPNTLGIYPWRELEIGDSFFVKDKKKNNISNMASQAGKRMARKFTIRAMEGGIRVWRTA
jgi:hypothetical protein